VQCFLVDAQRGQIVEQQAVAAAVEGCVDPLGRQAMIAGDALRDGRLSGWG
jgi:hypothetical protein